MPARANSIIDRLAEGIATIGAAFAPKPVIVRLSDFKSNEYANLIGGQRYEPDEENPMLGFRGASRYVAELPPCFELECERAEERARDDGPDQRRGDGALRAHRGARPNVVVQLAGGQRPEARREWPARHHDVRGAVERAAGRAVPRSLRRLLHRLERSHPADPGPGSRLGLVAGSVRRAQRRGQGAAEARDHACRKAGKYIGICGQGPSDHPKISPSGCSTRASRACRSIPTPWSRPGCAWRRMRRSAAGRAVLVWVVGAGWAWRAAATNTINQHQHPP
jgi:pyruvate,water dikinase